MTDLSHLKLYSPGYQAIEWGFGYDQIVDLDTALAQPCRIAVMPVFYDNPKDFSYRPEYLNVELAKFDLVLFTDIEWRSQTQIMSWIKTTGVENWLLHIAGLWLDETLHARTIYRPAWSFNFLRWNSKRSDFPLSRPFLFDCLLGARRPHRDYVMMNLQQSNLLDQSITTYRDTFIGHWITDTPKNIANLFPNQVLTYPYVSPNLDPRWEVKDHMDNSVSGLVPWEIYNRTWFTLVCETLSSGRVFLSAEKIAKCFHSRRLFVVFAIKNFLQHFRDWGFETFGDVIDESYDSTESDLERWSKAFEQVQYLCTENLPALLTKLKPRLDHNHDRLYCLDKEIICDMHKLVASYLK